MPASELDTLPVDMAWLCLDGAAIDDLDAQVRALTGFDHIWVWRGTDSEYRGSGYRGGPLLLPLTAQVREYFLSAWAPQGQGVIVLAPCAQTDLVTHLQRLRQITAADGDALPLGLGDARTREHIGEGLTSSSLMQWLGPIAALIWPDAIAALLRWWRLDNPSPHARALRHDGTLVLTAEDEAGLDRARRLGFLRHTADLLTAEFPGHLAALGVAGVERQLTIFLNEAERLALMRERDARDYIRLRFSYPQEPFVHDAALLAHLRDRALDGRLRVRELEHRLQQRYSTPQGTGHVQ